MSNTAYIGGRAIKTLLELIEGTSFAQAREDVEKIRAMAIELDEIAMDLVEGFYKDSDREITVGNMCITVHPAVDLEEVPTWIPCRVFSLPSQHGWKRFIEQAEKIITEDLTEGGFTWREL